MKYYVQVMRVFDNGDSDVQAWEVNYDVHNTVKEDMLAGGEPDLRALVPGEHTEELMDNAIDKSVILSGN